jgi:hypothetical protein
MVVPDGQADTLDHQMLPRLPPPFWRVTQNQRGVMLVEYGASGRAPFRGDGGCTEHSRAGDPGRADDCRERNELMPRALSSGIRVFSCRQGSTMVGYSSLALLVAIAAITLFGHADTETGGVSPRRSVGTISSD